MHRHAGKPPAHSLTILQHLLDLMDDDTSPVETGIDVHCSVFNETRPVSIHSARYGCKAGRLTTTTPAVAFAGYASYKGRLFPVPQHHHFLFRLTPF
jgi:hypothetical protein